IAPLERMTQLSGTHCGVIGAGGASRAVVFGLIERGATVTVFARDTEKASALSGQFSVEVKSLAGVETSDATIIVNTTPLGMVGSQVDLSPLPRKSLKNREIVYDLVYNPIKTRLLTDAEAEGCKTVSGIEMLVAQGAAQFKLWTGSQAPVDTMQNAVLRYL